MQLIQSAIILPTPAHARYMRFDLSASANAITVADTLRHLARRVDGKSIVMGLGLNVLTLLGKKIEGLRDFPQDLRMNNTDSPAALWCWLRGDERGELWQQGYEIEQLVKSAFTLRQIVDGFTHQSGRDLTGYEDGTENPKGNAAVQAAFVPSAAGDGLYGSSFVAVQQWVHEWPAFNAMDKVAQDNTIGRERESNEELDNAPESAHVKRTAQESFEPEAFVLRRSMPWTDGSKGGLMFVAFGCTLDAFEVQWRRMLGLDDGIQDALLQFSQPMTHDYYWCPPMMGTSLNLSYLGL